MVPELLELVVAAALGLYASPRASPAAELVVEAPHVLSASALMVCLQELLVEAACR